MTTTTNCCPAEFGGLRTMHCSGCHLNFSGLTAFDAHRTGSHIRVDRHCPPPNQSA
jgi:hypothetical protein